MSVEHHGGGLFLHHFERGIGRVGFLDLVSGSLDPTRQHLSYAVFVVNDQNQSHV